MRFLDRELQEDRECKVLMMEVVDGKPLSKARVNKFSEADRMLLRTQILQIVKTVYSCNVFHPHISPDNFLVSKNGSVRMIGFGQSYDPKVFSLSEEKHRDDAKLSLVLVENMLDDIGLKMELSVSQGRSTEAIHACTPILMRRPSTNCLHVGIEIDGS